MHTVSSSSMSYFHVRLLTSISVSQSNHSITGASSSSSNQVFKWADEEDDAPVMEWFDCDTEMLVTKRTWKYDTEEEETVCILGVKFFQHEDL